MRTGWQLYFELATEKGEVAIGAVQGLEEGEHIDRC